MDDHHIPRQISRHFQTITIDGQEHKMLDTNFPTLEAGLRIHPRRGLCHEKAGRVLRQQP